MFDIELILNGGFSPLRGFLVEDDYHSVVHTMRLNNGALWPIPVCLDVTEEFAQQLTKGCEIKLASPEGVTLATMHIASIYRPDLTIEAKQVFATFDKKHVGVVSTLKQNPVNLGGEVKLVSPIIYHDFVEFRFTPTQIKDVIKQRNWESVVAFQTRNPIHKAHMEIINRAIYQTGAALLLHPVVGLTKPGDIDHYTRVRCYKRVIERYSADSAILSLLPLAMRMAGPREAIWHALIRKNYGVSHFIVGRDHAGPGKDSAGKNFYSPYAAQKMALDYADEIGIKILPFEEMAFLANEKRVKYSTC